MAIACTQVRKRVIKILRDICVASAKERATAGKPGGGGGGGAVAAAGVGSPLEQPSAAPSGSAGKELGGMSGTERSIDACCRMVARLTPSEGGEVHMRPSSLAFARACTPLPVRAMCTSHAREHGMCMSMSGARARPRRLHRRVVHARP